MKYKKCPRCELNYIPENEDYCLVCKSELKLSDEYSEDLELCPICGVNTVSVDQAMCDSCAKKHSLDDIVKVNEVISPLIDEADLIKGRYMLDVTTLGVEKPIDVSNLEKYVARYVAIHLSNPYKGMNNMEGFLKEVNENEIHLEYREKQRKLKLGQ